MKSIVKSVCIAMALVALFLSYFVAPMLYVFVALAGVLLMCGKIIPMVYPSISTKVKESLENVIMNYQTKRIN